MVVECNLNHAKLWRDYLYTGVYTGVPGTGSQGRTPTSQQEWGKEQEVVSMLYKSYVDGVAGCSRKGPGIVCMLGARPLQ